MNTVFIKNFSPPPFNRKEILRYAGVKVPDDTVNSLLDDCLKEAENVFSYSVCYGEFSVSICDDGVDLSFAKILSRDLAKNLAGCESIVVFAATVGIGLDRLVSRYAKISPSRALMLNALGAERIESLCDNFNQYIAEEKKANGLFTAPRFSPGYGDLSLTLQQEIFKVLDPSRKIGLSLNNSLLMSPSKSVTALIGVTPCDKKTMASTSCKTCQKGDCQFRRYI